jgi:hypothetical protein
MFSKYIGEYKYVGDLRALRSAVERENLGNLVLCWLFSVVLGHAQQ